HTGPFPRLPPSPRGVPGAAPQGAGVPELLPQSPGRAGDERSSLPRLPPRRPAGGDRKAGAYGALAAAHLPHAALGGGRLLARPAAGGRPCVALQHPDVRAVQSAGREPPRVEMEPPVGRLKACQGFSGTRSRISVPCPGSLWMERWPPTDAALRYMLSRPR